MNQKETNLNILRSTFKLPITDYKGSDIFDDVILLFNGKKIGVVSNLIFDKLNTKDLPKISKLDWFEVYSYNKDTIDSLVFNSVERPYKIFPQKNNGLLYLRNDNGDICFIVKVAFQNSWIVEFIEDNGIR